MTLNKMLRAVLKTAVYIMDQTAEQVDRVSERASDLADNAREAIYPQSHATTKILSFAAGIGVGVGLGILLAPTSGTELRNTISDKVHDISNRVKGREEEYPTGTEAR